MKMRIVLPALVGAVALLGVQAVKADAMALAQSSGCTACHAIDKKIVGPSWKDVAVRYKGDPAARDMLISKVKVGGAGNWNDVTGGMPMPPNSPRVSDENIAALVDFLLSLE